MTDRIRCDVVVLGSGFAASLLSAILSREGMSVAVIDRARHPRFTIGESSTPIADSLLKELVERHELGELRPLVTFGTWRKAYPHLPCGCKRGFSYIWHGAEEGFQATADHRDELFVTANASREIADTQWYRPELDRFLAAVAQHRGVMYLEAAEVAGIEHPHQHAWTVTVDHEGRRKQLQCPFVVDASGPAGVLMQRLPVQDWSDRLQTHSSAVYSHWKDVPLVAEWLQQRGAVTEDHPYPADDAAVHHLFPDGWLWQLRFEDNPTSLGYVFAGDHARRPDASAEQLWSEVVQRHPVLREILAGSRLTEFPGRFYRTGRLQRLRSAAADRDWAALPFTVGFIDPLHSTGIAHTLSGVDRLSRMLLSSSDEQRSGTLRAYSRDVVGELRHIDRLVAGCYAALGDFRLFTAWSMVYFAAATSSEKRRSQAPEEKSGFLCADDEEFVQRVRDLLEATYSLRDRDDGFDRAAVDDFLAAARDAVAPYNHVGLFEPAVPNMYHHTAASK